MQPIHTAVGITILVLMVVPPVMRFTVKRPADATAGHKLLDILARVVHYGLYLSVLTVTAHGVTFTAQSGILQSAFMGSRPEFNGPPLGSRPLHRAKLRAGPADVHLVDSALPHDCSTDRLLTW